jgi:hypothetical protein
VADTSLNESPLDGWTVVHTAAGIASGAAGLSAPVSIAGAVAYEVVEYAHEWPKGSKLFGSKRPESGINIAVDIGVFVFGWWLGRKIRNAR